MHGQADGGLAQRLDGLGLIGDSLGEFGNVCLQIERAQAEIANALRGLDDRLFNRWTRDFPHL